MVRVSWVPGATDVPGHRITYSTNHGSDVKQVLSKHAAVQIHIDACDSLQL